MSFTFADLFAGIGGFHLALERLGGRCVFACEIDPHARKTYAANFPGLQHFAADIAAVNVEDVPEIDVLCAGFPCQPFSQAGHKRGFSEEKDRRGNMFFEIVRLLEAKRPRAFLLENVRHLLQHDSGRTFAVVLERLQHLGYRVHHQIVKASDYGLPQHRPRVFIVGFRDETVEFAFPPPIPLRLTLDQVWGAPCERRIGYTLRVGGRASGLHDRRNWDLYRVAGETSRLTPREGRRLMGFPDDFVFPVSETQAMKQLGNSVAVDAVYAVARAMVQALRTRG